MTCVAAESSLREMANHDLCSEGAWHEAHDRLFRSHQELEAGERRRTEELAQANAALGRNLAVLRVQQEATVGGILVVNEDGPSRFL